jgi:hypothetical protein
MTPVEKKRGRAISILTWYMGQSLPVLSTREYPVTIPGNHWLHSRKYFHKVQPTMSKGLAGSRTAGNSLSLLRMAGVQGFGDGCGGRASCGILERRSRRYFWNHWVRAVCCSGAWLPTREKVSTSWTH